MRGFLSGLLATTALAGFSLPAAAADFPIKGAVAQQRQQVSGYLEMEGGFAWLNNSGQYDQAYFGGQSISTRDNQWLFNGAGRVNTWWGRNYSTQFDVWGGADSFARTNGDNNGVIANVNLGSHFSYRDSSHLFGVFGAVGGIGSNDNCCHGGAAFTHATFGAEAQWYLGNLTLYGQAGLQTNLSDGNDGGTYRAWFVRLVGRYFVNDNLKLEAFAAYANARGGEDFYPTSAFSADRFTAYQVSWGLGVEKRFEGTPFSGFLRYEGNFTSFDHGYNSGVHFVSVDTLQSIFKFGFRVYLNENTLKYNDRNGTTLDIRDPFTSIYRGAGRTHPTLNF